MNSQIILPTVIVAGFFDSLNPCAISVALLFVALMFTMQKSRSLILRIGFFYILSVYVTYFFIGIGLLQLFHFFDGLFSISQLIVKITAVVVIIFGILNLKEYFFPHLPFKLRMSIKARHKISELAHKISISAVIIMGFIVGIAELPCSGSVYFAILGLLSTRVTFYSGVLYLLLYNLLFISPLILVFLLSTNRVITEKMINWQEREGRKMHLILALIMVALGVGLLFLHL